MPSLACSPPSVVGATWHVLLCSQCPPYAIPRRRFDEQAIAGGERLALQLWVLSELGDVSGHDYCALDLVPARVSEAGRPPAEAFLLLRAVGREYPPLRLLVVEPAGFAIHHELFGAVKSDAALGVGVSIGILDRVPDEWG